MIGLELCMKASTLESTESLSLSDWKSELSSSVGSLDDDDDLLEEALLVTDSQLVDVSGPSSKTFAKKTSSPGLTTIVSGSNDLLGIGATGVWTKKALCFNYFRKTLYLPGSCCVSFLLHHRRNNQAKRERTRTLKDKRTFVTTNFNVLW